MLGRDQERSPRRSPVYALGALALTAGMLAGCGASSDTAELVWYINPDSGGQAAIAEACSTDDYTITTQVLPQASDQQRIQLARRLAAEDSEIDLMSLDPPFTAEFASAGFLDPVPDDAVEALRDQGTFEGAMDAATWDDQLVVYPFWSNTQVLWFRKSFADRAGLDMSTPKTWDELIEAAAKNDGKFAVQANKYEGYVVWINALIAGAGGQILDHTDRGIDADITIADKPGQVAAAIIEKLASSPAAPADLSVSNEGTAGSTFASDGGAFMVNWTYIFHNYDETSPDVAKDIGYARYPRSVEGEDSRPPYGGIGIGVSAFSEHRDLAQEAAQCLVKPENQGINAEMTGNMPASSKGYEQSGVTDNYPKDLLALFQESVDAAAPRTVTPYWSDVSGAIQSSWHPASSVDSDTPQRSADFIREVLDGKRLL